MSEFTVPTPVVRHLAKQARRFRDLALEAFYGPAEGPGRELEGGWRIAPYDPTRLLEVFPHIWLLPAFRIAAYQYVAGGNGNGFPFALPEAETLPAPPADLTLGWAEDGSAVLVGGSAALPDWLDPQVEPFLDGDGSPISYFEASLFSRELRELGAMWHGCSWSEHVVLTSRSWKALDDLEWVESRPRELRPRVSSEPDRPHVVVFYSFTDLVSRRVIRHRDVFEQGYCFKTSDEVVAEGGPGKIF